MCFLQNFVYQIPAGRFVFQHARGPSEGPRPEVAAEKGKETPKDSAALERFSQQALNIVIDAAMRKLEAARKAGSDQKLHEIAAGLKQFADNPYYILGGVAGAGSAPDVLYPWVKEALQKPRKDEDKGKQK